MVDRQKVEAILARRFPGASREQVAAAANAIMGLPDEWQEVLHQDHHFGYHFAGTCGSVPCLPSGVGEEFEFRLFTKAHP